MVPGNVSIATIWPVVTYMERNALLSLTVASEPTRVYYSRHRTPTIPGCPANQHSLSPILLDSQPFVNISSPRVKVIPVLDRDALRHMIDLVNSDQSLRELKHVVPQRDDNELCVLRALFDVGRYDRYLMPYHLVSEIYVPSTGKGAKVS